VDPLSLMDHSDIAKVYNEVYATINLLPLHICCHFADSCLSQMLPSHNCQLIYICQIALYR
jgi:hypothetical protein